MKFTPIQTTHSKFVQHRFHLSTNLEHFTTFWLAKMSFFKRFVYAFIISSKQAKNNKNITQNLDLGIHSLSQFVHSHTKKKQTNIFDAKWTLTWRWRRWKFGLFASIRHRIKEIVNHPKIFTSFYKKNCNKFLKRVARRLKSTRVWWRSQEIMNIIKLSFTRAKALSSSHVMILCKYLKIVECWVHFQKSFWSLDYHVKPCVWLITWWFLYKSIINVFRVDDYKKKLNNIDSQWWPKFNAAVFTLKISLGSARVLFIHTRSSN